MQTSTEDNMTPSPEEQFIILADVSPLLKKSQQFISSTYKGHLHSNRYIDTGWQNMKFDFTVTDQHFMKCFLCRPIRRKEDLALLIALLNEVPSLQSSGICNFDIIFSLTLMISAYDDAIQGDINSLVKKYAFVENVHYIN
jgi:hypothetical protein